MIKKWLQNLFYNWDLIRLISKESAKIAESKMYADLSNRIQLETLISELNKIKDNGEKYICAATIIEIQARNHNK
jgi:hypothetical protein